MNPALLFPRAFEHPADAMLACHERIRRFLDGARRLAALPDPSDPLGPGAAVLCARYFRQGLPLHTLDEDESLGPRLRRIAPPEIVAAIDRMSGEHDAITAAIDTLLPLLDAVATGAPVPGDFAAAVEVLGAALDPHLAIEEAVILPAARRLLGEAAILEIRAEMEQRRR